MPTSLSELWKKLTIAQATLVVGVTTALCGVLPLALQGCAPERKVKAQFVPDDPGKSPNSGLPPSGVLKAGEVQICWGSIYTDNPSATPRNKNARITFPVKFKEPPIVTFDVQPHQATGQTTTWGTFKRTVTATGCEADFIGWDFWGKAGDQELSQVKLQVDYVAVGVPQ